VPSVSDWVLFLSLSSYIMPLPFLVFASSCTVFLSVSLCTMLPPTTGPLFGIFRTTHLTCLILIILQFWAWKLRIFCDVLLDSLFWNRFLYYVLSQSYVPFHRMLISAVFFYVLSSKLIWSGSISFMIL
jgi:hypothetical protein